MKKYFLVCSLWIIPLLGFTQTLVVKPQENFSSLNKSVTTLVSKEFKTVRTKPIFVETKVCPKKLIIIRFFEKPFLRVCPKEPKPNPKA